MAHVRVSMLISYRIQLLENSSLDVSYPDGSLTVKLTFRDHEVPKASEDLRGEGVDDGRGIFLKSWVMVDFPSDILVDTISQQQWHYAYLQAGISLFNRFVDSYRYVTNHAFAHRIAAPEQYDVRVVDDRGEMLPGIEARAGFNFPGGIALKRTFLQPDVNKIQDLLNGKEPLRFEQVLLLDGESFAAIGDVSHAVLNACTALEVFIRRILDAEDEKLGFYSAWDTGLSGRFGHSLYECVFVEEKTFRDIEAFEMLEYIRVVRDAIAHEGRPLFRLRYLRAWRSRSRYLEAHQKSEGKRVSTESAVILVDAARKIISWTEQMIGRANEQSGDTPK